MNGVGIPTAQEMAYDWFEHAAYLGNGDAMYALADMMYEDARSFKERLEVVAGAQRSGKAGNVNGMFNTACCYEQGYGIRMNKEKAFRWFKKASDAGDGAASHRVGRCYEEGIGVPQNIAQAMAFYQKAIRQGSTEALARLAKIN